MQVTAINSSIAKYLQSYYGSSNHQVLLSWQRLQLANVRQVIIFRMVAEYWKFAVGIRRVRWNIVIYGCGASNVLTRPRYINMNLDYLSFAHQIAGWALKSSTVLVSGLWQMHNQKIDWKFKQSIAKGETKNQVNPIVEFVLHMVREQNIPVCILLQLHLLLMSFTKITKTHLHA